MDAGRFYVSDSVRARLAPGRARELYIAPLGVRLSPQGDQPLPSLGFAGRGTSFPKPSEMNRKLLSRCDELSSQNVALMERFASVDRELGELRQRTTVAESSERQLRSDMKHIVQRNSALESVNEQLGEKLQLREKAVEAKWAASASGADESDASTTAAVSPPALELQKPPRPVTPQHMNSFLSLVEKGLTRELDRAAAAEESGGPAPNRERTGRQISLRTQLRQLADMQKEVSQLQKYTEAVQTFSDKLTRQLRLREADNASLKEQLNDREREAEASLAHISTQLLEAQTQLAQNVQNVQHAESWRAKALSSDGKARNLTDELLRSESQLGEMRSHVERMLSLHEGLTEAAIVLGASDSEIGSLIEELDRRLGGTIAQDLATQLDELVVGSVGGGPGPRLPSPTARPRLSSADVSLKSAAPVEPPAVTRTRSSFLVARRYLLSTRVEPQQSPSPSPLPTPQSSPLPSVGWLAPSLARSKGGAPAPSPKGRVPALLSVQILGSSGSDALAVSGTGSGLVPAPLPSPLPPSSRPLLAAKRPPRQLTVTTALVTPGTSPLVSPLGVQVQRGSSDLLAPPARDGTSTGASPLRGGRFYRPAAG
mmetsp:Transcript_20231/g.47827  ORF Transcript_20231/g.47827 Transcript_20231/m.47827 type:complete len:600 (-) Transcript_20231:86-1885(-)